MKRYNTRTSEYVILDLLSSFPLVGILSTVSNDRHVAIHPTAPHTAPLTASPDTQHLWHPVGIHPASDGNSRSVLATCCRAQHPFLLPLPLAVRVLLRAQPLSLILSQN